MKRIMVAIVALLCITLYASAQEKSELKQYKKVHHKGNRHKEMLKELNLTEAQQKQLKSNKDEFRDNLQALNKEENITVKEMRERKASLVKDHKTKNNAVFTTEQKEKMAAIKLKKQEAAKQRSQKRLEQMRSTLSLTDDQVAKLKAQDENTRNQIKEIRQNETLDHVAKKEKLMALKQTAKEQRKAVLTDDQLKKLEASKKDCKPKEPAKASK